MKDKLIVIVFCWIFLSSLPSFAQERGNSPANPQMTESARGLLQEAVRRIYLDLITKLDQEDADEVKSLLATLPGANVQEKADHAAAAVIAEYKEAFLVNEEEAKVIAAGVFDNTKNLKQLDSYISKAADSHLPLPWLHRYLIQKHQLWELYDVDLELAVRLFREMLKE